MVSGQRRTGKVGGPEAARDGVWEEESASHFILWVGQACSVSASWRYSLANITGTYIFLSIY